MNNLGNKNFNEHLEGDKLQLMTKPSGNPANVKNRYVEKKLKEGWKMGYQGKKLKEETDNDKKGK